MRGFRVTGPEGGPGGVPGAVEKPGASLGQSRHNYEHAIWRQIVSTVPRAGTRQFNPLESIAPRRPLWADNYDSDLPRRFCSFPS